MVLKEMFWKWANAIGQWHDKYGNWRCSTTVVFLEKEQIARAPETMIL